MGLVRGWLGWVRLCFACLCATHTRAHAHTHMNERRRARELAFYAWCDNLLARPIAVNITSCSSLLPPSFLVQRIAGFVGSGHCINHQPPTCHSRFESGLCVGFFPRFASALCAAAFFCVWVGLLCACACFVACLCCVRACFRCCFVVGQHVGVFIFVLFSPTNQPARARVCVCVFVCVWCVCARAHVHVCA